jgi:glycosyltransferase involved in cell wall biosynthesis
MGNPRVSFVVPCYKLGHLLPECLRSILSQSFEDFEILIMNDRSPDDTEQVAETFVSPRVRHIKNEQNLGHLRNYNKGIDLSRGEYIWLISADDYLRSPNVLEKYVRLMDAEPTIGYTVCAGYSVIDGQEREIVGAYGRKDAVVKGHVFLKALLDSNFVLAASAMVRRKCYQDLGAFPLNASWQGQAVDMGWLGDWYLWCIFAMYFDVGYFADPMVCYRTHDMSMTNNITRRETIANCAYADVGMLWMIRERAQGAGFRTLAQNCLIAIANEYAKQGASKRYRSANFRMSRSEFEFSLRRSTESGSERQFIRARYLEGTADLLMRRGKRSFSTQYYLASMKQRTRPKVLIKLLLGGGGTRIREILSNTRRSFLGLRRKGAEVNV